MKNIQVLLIFCVVFSSSCIKNLCKDVPLNLSRQTLVNAPLKTNGYYYSDVDGKSFRLAVFYLNGLMMNVAFDDVIVAENFMIGKGNVGSGKNEWGLFEVSVSQIRIASRIPRPCGLWAELRTGKILNDSTFLLDYQEIKTKKMKQKPQSLIKNIILKLLLLNPIAPMNLLNRILG